MNSLKDVFGSFFMFDRFFYIYIYCRKCDDESNKLIQIVGHPAPFFEKIC